MKKLLLVAALWLGLAAPALAVNVNIDGLPAATSVTGTSNLFECEQSGTNNQCTSVQIAAYIYGLMSGDATASGTGAITFATVNANVGTFGSATQCITTTQNAKGLTTAISAATCTPAVGSITGTGTGVITALGINVGTAGAFVVNGGALGTPSSGTATNLTGTAAGLTAGNVTTNANLTGMVTSVGNAASLGSFTSANLAAALTDETGSGANVFGTAPTMSSVTINTALTLGFLTGAGTECMQVSNTGVVSGTGSACGGSGSTGANPTATAGPAAVNGSATTFLRSDGAPAIQLGTAAQKGIVQVDGTTITASSGVITAVNTGTVTSVAAGCGTSTGGSAITGTGTVSAAITRRLNSTTSDTIVAADCGNLVAESNAASIAVAIAQAGTTGFAAGTYFEVCNIGAGTATITPTTSTIGGASTYALPGGSASAPKCTGIQSDGTNYNVVPDWFTVGTAAAQNTGTSGANLPFLNGTNTWSGVQTFGNVFGAVSTQSGTTYTLASTDCGTEVAFTNAAAVTVTIPAALTTGCNIAILQTTAAGQVTVTGTAVSAATLHSAHSYTKTFGQWAIIGINIYTTGVAILTGDGA